MRGCYSPSLDACHHNTMDGTMEYCPYAVLCHVPQIARSTTAVDAMLISNDLLVAIDRRKLHLFSRRPRTECNHCESLVKNNESSKRTSAATAKRGYHCPHIASYVDVVHALTIPVSSISQILMTYQTLMAKGVATRTKDLVIRMSTPSPQAALLWLEFEHNLARGWFLEALTAASSPTIIDMDYLDLSDTPAINEQLSCQYRGSLAQLFSPVLLVLSLPGFLRDAWRHIIFDKVKLALQIAHDNPTTIDCPEDPTVALLLTTAVELATRLDEPDLIAFTWLASGFLNAQATSRPGSHALASAQVLHSLTLAKEYSLEYLTCLALQCAADIHLRLGGDDATALKARELLHEAAKLITISENCNAMEPSLKMQVHAKLHELVHAGKTDQRSRMQPVQRAHSVTMPTALLGRRDLLAATRSGSSSTLDDPKTKKKAMAFSLWMHVFGSNLGATASTLNNIKTQLLSRVPRLPGETFKCVVEVVGAHGSKKARLRVFYDALTTVEWLHEHIAKRYTVIHRCAPDAGDGNARVQIELFYDPQRKQLVPSEVWIVLAQWVRPHAWITATTAYVLHAKLRLAVVSSHRSSITVATIPRSEGEQRHSGNAPTVLCSLCGKHIPLQDVETHSETCF